MNLREAAAACFLEFATHPEDVYTVRIDQIFAGVLVRRRLRTAFDVARIHGADVDVTERKGLLDSVFTVRMSGNAQQLSASLAMLAGLERSCI